MTAATASERQPVQTVILDESILFENDQLAAANRALLREHGVYAINLIGSPGAGKTTLLVETLRALSRVPSLRCAVIEGDQQTSRDADRIAETNVPVVQVNTQMGCHLDALQVQRSLQELPLDSTDLLFIENVGNLVCPAAYDLGEAEKVVIMSVTEGEDKPIKYPLIFHLAHTLVLTKIDLLPHLRFDVDACRGFAHRVNDQIQIVPTSAYTHDGLDDWLALLQNQVHTPEGES